MLAPNIRSASRDVHCQFIRYSWGRNFHRTWTIKPACRLKSLLRTPDHITQESHWISTKTEALSYFAFGASVLEV